MKNMSQNDFEMISKTIKNPSQSSLKTSSKREVIFEEGLRRGFQVCHDSPGVNFAREGGDLGGWDYYFPTRREPFRERSADFSPDFFFAVAIVSGNLIGTSPTVFTAQVYTFGVF